MPRETNAADITSHDTYLSDVPHATFERLRRERPVAWIEESEPGGSGFWAVTRYDDVVAVSKDHETFTCTRGIRLEEMEEDELEARRSMMELDPPEHSRLRRIVQPSFSRKTVGTYEKAFRAIAGERIDSALALGNFDFVTEIARELPIRILCRLLGVPDGDAERLVDWGDQMISNADPEYSKAVVDRVDTREYRLLPFRSPAGIEVYRYAERLLGERRAAPREDILSELLSLSDLEFKNFFALLMVAGNETTRHTIAHGLLALMANPEAMADWREHPELAASATEEILRWSTVTMHFRRTARRDTRIRDVSIRAGDKVVMWYVSANYDEDVFDEPLRFDIRRAPNEHLTFGAGHHFCLGAWLARLEIRVTFEELIRRVRGVELVGPIERLRSNFIRGVKHMPVRVSVTGQASRRSRSQLT